MYANGDTDKLHYAVNENLHGSKENNTENFGNMKSEFKKNFSYTC